jgi:hypothetical protein
MTRDAGGQQCRKAAIRGGAVCQTHGGGAPQVKRKAAERRADLIDPDRALREAARVAYSDIRELFDEHGRLKHPAELSKDFAAAIRSFDKVGSLGLLFKHLGLLKEPRRLAASVEFRWADSVDDRLKAARDRLAAPSGAMEGTTSRSQRCVTRHAQRMERATHGRDHAGVESLDDGSDQGCS